jgi:hypothetical protein
MMSQTGEKRVAAGNASDGPARHFFLEASEAASNRCASAWLRRRGRMFGAITRISTAITKKGIHTFFVYKSRLIYKHGLTSI